MNNLYLKISGMHCMSCGLLIEEAVKEIDGVKNAKVDMEKSLLQVEISGAQNAENMAQNIKNAVNKEGYSVVDK